jgi:predicted  nucleic acid-binding Zn-ribbon protein
MNLSIKELNELIYSLGIASHNGRFVNKDVNESLLEKLYSELNSKIAEEAIDEEVESSTYYVTNEEADEDAKQRDYSAFNDYASTLQQDSDRYESSVMKDYTNYIAKLNERGFVTQALLDYVDKKGAVSYSELQTYYRIITGGSNSFSHILDNLRTPYKNRKTQRYIAKEGKRYTDALYVIKVANPSNWVVA